MKMITFVSLVKSIMKVLEHPCTSEADAKEENSQVEGDIPDLDERLNKSTFTVTTSLRLNMGLRSS